jgi:cytochrome P450
MQMHGLSESEVADLKKNMFRLGRGAIGPEPEPLRAPSDAIDLSAPEIASAPYQAYEQLRQRHGPLVYLERHKFWIVLGDAEVRHIFARADLFSSDPYHSIDAVLVGADAPAHGPIRKLVAQQLDAGTLRRVAGDAQVQARALVADRFDPVAEFAAPIARASSANLIGLADAEVDALAELDRQGQHSNRPFWALREGLTSIAPHSSIFDRLIANSGGTLNFDDAVSLVRFLWLASSVTTERTISRAILLLAQDAELRHSVSNGAVAMNAFVEEVLRMYPPEHMMPRRATGDVQVGEAHISAGDQLRLCLSAANRDPKAFGEPHVFNPHRAPNRHQSFGSGPHVCIGAAMTRKVIPAVLAALLEEAPGLYGPLGPVQHAASAEGYYLRAFQVGRGSR